MDKEKDYLLKCNCGCGIICFNRWFWEKAGEDWIDISHYPLGFSAHQEAKFWHRIQVAWKFLIGKQYWLWGVSAPTEDFIDTLRQIVEDYDNGEF